MKYTKLFFLAALLGTVLASCQKEVDVKPEEQPVDKTGWTLTVNATMDSATKAMSLDGTTLKAYWKAGEAVGVYLGGTKLGTLTAGNITDEGAKAVLSGILDTVEGLTVDSEIMLLFPDKDEWSYVGQDGSAPSESGTMATGYDYATSTLTVTNLVDKKVTVDGSASFTNQQSVYRLKFKVGESIVAVKSIAISADADKLVRTRSYGSSDWESNCGPLTMDPATPEANLYYMAIRNDNTSADVYSFTVVRNSDNAVLEGTKNIPADALASPQYIPVSVTVSQKTVAQAAPATTITSDAEVL